MIEQIATAILNDKGENHLDAMALGGRDEGVRDR